MRPPIRLAIFLFGLLTILSCSSKKDVEMMQTVQLKFNNRAGSNALVLNTAFITPLGEQVTPVMFKYYVTNIVMVHENGAELALPDYTFLIDEAKPDSKLLSLMVPAGQRFKEIRFLLGVDSTRNVSGVQTGALDPVNGMFWTWNTGYIMAKFEGRSALSTAPLQAVTYHIGGFRKSESALKNISLLFPAIVATNTANQVVINADAAKWFAGIHNISVATTNMVMEPGVAAQKIADNYSQMFTVVQIVPM